MINMRKWEVLVICKKAFGVWLLQFDWREIPKISLLDFSDNAYKYKSV